MRAIIGPVPSQALAHVTGSPTYNRIKLKLVAPAYLTATGSSGTESRRAPSGKSHHRRSGLLLVNKATRHELLVIDGDVLGAGAAAVNDGNQDYVAFWGYVLSVCREVRGNGLVPVIPCTCLPEQLLSATTDEILHLLALLSDEHTLPARIEARTGGDQLSLAKHLEFDANLRQARVPPPHTLQFLDVTTTDETGTIETSGSWTAAAIGGTPRQSLAAPQRPDRQEMPPE